MTHKELNFQLLFQLAYLKPESGLRDPQDFRRPCEALLLAHSNEIRQLSDIHARTMPQKVILPRPDAHVIIC